MNERKSANDLTISPETQDIPLGGETRSFASVRGGLLEVHHPEEGPYPMVIPHPKVSLSINDCQCTEPMPVSKEDKVELHTCDEIQKGHWSIDVSGDGLEAILRIEPTVVVHRRLPDIEPARMLKLKVEEEVERLSPLTWEELLKELSDKDIKYGLDFDECFNAIKSPSGGEVVIAKGIPTEPGEEGRVELLFSTDPKVPIEVAEDEVIDFKNRFSFTSVAGGEVLAVKHPAVMGCCGTGVCGETIAPPKPKDFILCAGEGAIITKDGLRVVARQPGRPTALRRHDIVKVSVVNELLHRGDVNLTSGNIVFKGDVLISGNVTENMLVQSGENVSIRGTVSGARVQAAGTVFVGGNIISSEIIAGNSPDFKTRILPQLSILAQGLEYMSTVIARLPSYRDFARGHKKYIGPLVKVLLDTKLSHLIDAARALNGQTEILMKEVFSNDLRDFIRDVDNAIVKFPMMLKELSDITRLYCKAEELLETYQSHHSDENNVAATNIQNSTVFASGNVQVIGAGCYISNIRAGGKININGSVRGGQIEADGDIFVEELGSKGGSVAKVFAGPSSVVTLGYAHVNSMVIFAGQSYRFDREKSHVRCRLDSEGRLNVI